MDGRSLSPLWINWIQRESKRWGRIQWIVMQCGKLEIPIWIYVCGLLNGITPLIKLDQSQPIFVVRFGQLAKYPPTITEVKYRWKSLNPECFWIAFCILTTIYNAQLVNVSLFLCSSFELSERSVFRSCKWKLWVGVKFECGDHRDGCATRVEDVRQLATISWLVLRCHCDSSHYVIVVLTMAWFRLSLSTVRVLRSVHWELPRVLWLLCVALSW